MMTSKTRDSKAVQSSFLLITAAAVWGFAFVAQRMGMEHVGPFTFNAIRFLLGALSLTPLMWFLQHRKSKKATSTESSKGIVKWGVIAGIALFAGSSFQQVGLITTTAGNAGFITGLYVIFVPLLGLFVRQKTQPIVWIAALMAVVGMYFLTVEEGFAINIGDLLVLVSALFFAIHVLIIGHLTQLYDAIKLSIVQFLACGFLSLVVALAIETITLDGIFSAAIPILYGGLISVGAGYTLQVFGQKHSKPAPAAIILSTEAVFAVIGGVLILHETMDVKSLFGCSLMFAGMVLAQIKFPLFHTQKSAL